MTMTVEGKKFLLKARRLSSGVGGIKYFVSVNDWRSRVVVRLGELTGPNMEDSALSLALEKGMARWLKGDPSYK
tara:strand:+ start:355 stop:576 length:222 start_codon:yes stop_codon:yes gene_type:complete